MRKLFALCFSFQFVNLVAGQALPVAGHAYQLWNQYSGDNPYEYLAWTTSASLAKGATSDFPGVYMYQSSSSATTPPPRSLWTFELQSDGVSYYIYNTDESYGSSEKRLDVHAEGLTPFLYTNLPSDQAPGQLWQLISYNDGTNFQIYNVFWRKALDINGGGVTDYPINGPFMNTPATTNAGEKWQFGDSTPTTKVTTTVLSIQTSTVTPPIQTSTLQGSSATITTTSTIFVTQTLTTTVTASAHQNAKRAYVITVTSVVGTAYSVSISYTTLPVSTTYIAGGGAVITNTATTTSTIQNTITITTTNRGGVSSAAPTTDSGTTSTLPNGSSSSTTPVPSATDAPISGLTRDQQIAVGVGVPSAVFAFLGLFIAWRRSGHRI